MQGYNIISGTLPSSGEIFLQLNYIQITTTFASTLIFKRKQINLLIISHSTNTLPGSSDSITISTEAIIIKTPHSPFVYKPYFYTSPQEMFARSNPRFEKQQE